MPGEPLRPEEQREALLAAVAAEGPPMDRIDVSDAVFEAGWENVVLNTSDGWILRFPRQGPEAYRRELAVLERLRGRLTVPIPRVEFTGRLRDFAGYRRLDGVHLDRSGYQDAGPAVRDRVAASLAAFLAAMHGALDAGQIAELGIPDFHQEGFYPGPATRLPDSLQPRLEALRDRERSLAAAVRRRPVLLHNDFHSGNMVLTEQLGRLAAVWDFSCVATGDPSLDFRYLIWESADLAQRVASFYAARTGQEVDLGLAAVALRLEQVTDAITEGEDPAPYL